MKLSVVLPAYNEQDNLAPLYAELQPVLARITKDYEIIIVDDGSRDATFERALELSKKDPRVRVVKFRRNFGQGAALDAGFKAAKGDIIVYMDADLQMDPNDIPAKIRKIDEAPGYDAVIGWRWQRKDSFFKRCASHVAAGLRSVLTGVKIHDAG